MVPRLLTKYNEEIVPALKERFKYKNIYMIPRVEKIVINMGLGRGARDHKVIEAGVRDLTLIAGQKAVITRAKKSISNFKIRKGMPVGCMVTLRRERMYEFLDRLISIALPRVRDFKGLSPNGFDGNGNYTFGIKDQTIFLEIDQNKVEHTLGMNVSIVTTAKTDEEAKALLDMFGMPFRK